MVVTEYDFEDGESGNIERAGGSYTATTGSSSCEVERIFFGNDIKKAFFKFDTSDIPTNAIITKVEFYPVDRLVQPVNDASGFLVYIGDIIGSSLSGTQGEMATKYAAGTKMLTEVSLPNQTWKDLSDDGHNPTIYVNKGGDTDIAIWGQYGGWVDQGHNYNKPRNKCALRVTWYVRPQVI